jgi:hypothetical protein
LLDDLVTICANWKAEKSLGIEEYAAVIKVSGVDIRDKEYYFKNDSFIVSVISEIKQTDEIKLIKSKTMEHVDGVEKLKLLLPCDKIQRYFPAKQQKYGDDCYLQELTNMLATGKFYYKSSVKEDAIEIMKSPKFTFHIGARIREK